MSLGNVIRAMRDAGASADAILCEIERLHDAPPWQEARASVLERDGNVCRYCGSETDSPHVDHITPRCKGGGDRIENLVVACPACNLSKGGRTPDEWRQNPNGAVRETV